MKHNQFHCFSLKLAGYLMLKGFVLFEIQENHDGYKKVYMFKDSDLLRNVVEEYKLFKKTFN